MPLALALTPTPWQQFLDANGIPLAGGKLYTYEAGGFVPATVYQDSIGTAHENPIILDAFGQCTIYLPASNRAFKFVLTTADDVPVRTQDNIIWEFPENFPPAPGLNADTLDGHDGAEFLLKTEAVQNPPFAGLNADLIDGLSSARFVWNTITTDYSGVAHNWNPNNALVPGQPTFLRLVPGALLQVGGFIAGIPGQLLVVKNYGTGLVELYHLNAGSAAGNQFINFVGGATVLAAAGAAIYIYDPGGFWVLLAHEQGAYLPLPYAAGNFFAVNQGAWAVASHAIVTYKLQGRELIAQIKIGQSVITNAANYLAIRGWPYTLIGTEPFQTAWVWSVERPRWTEVMTHTTAGPAIVLANVDLAYWGNSAYTDVQAIFRALVA